MRPQEPSLLPKVSLADAEYVSTVEQSKRNPGTATTEPPQFSATVFLSRNWTRGHEEVEEAGNCRCMVTRTSTTRIYFPPRPGGDPLRVGPLGSGCADHPPVDPRRTDNPAPRTAMGITNTRPRNHSRLLLLLLLFTHLNKLAVVVGGHGFVHQLFCHLRHAEHSGLRDDVLRSDLGHVDHLLRHHSFDRPEHFHQLVHCLRHRSVEDLHHGSNFGRLLHGAPLDSLLRSRRLCQAGRPPPAGLFFVQAEELWLGRRTLPGLRRVLQLALLLPGPGLLLSP